MEITDPSYIVYDIIKAQFHQEEQLRNIAQGKILNTQIVNRFCICFLKDFFSDMENLLEE